MTPKKRATAREQISDAPRFSVSMCDRAIEQIRAMLGDRDDWRLRKRLEAWELERERAVAETLR